MYVNQDQKIAYLAHPKTASNAVRRALIGRRGFEQVDGHHDGLESAGSPVTLENRSEWLVATAVRNPWDIAVTWIFAKYRDEAANGIGFRFTVDRFREALDTSSWLAPDGRLFFHADAADRILRFESIEADLGEILELRGLEPVAVPLVNVTHARARYGGGDWRKGRRAEYRSFYTDETRAYIAKRFTREIAEYGYEF